MSNYTIHELVRTLQPKRKIRKWRKLNCGANEA
jgi:hypothetical protein